MKLTRDEVLKIANLARLELSEAEVERYATQLSAILEYIEKLNRLDLTGIEPTAHAVLVPTPYRKDEMIQDSKEKSLANAPDREVDFFRVPRVLA